MGVPVLRLRGDYLAIVTLAFGEIIKISSTSSVGIDGKDSTSDPERGRAGPGRGRQSHSEGAHGRHDQCESPPFTAGFILVLIALTVVLNLINSRSGRAIMALRDNRIAAESVGISATKYKLMAFVTSAVLAGAPVPCTP